jgi:dolichol-phosphate mannosyltransferase|tara:strand:- start:537 stop:1670 length:1134 start_codon:yes stop_codon:yes gene_type:complete
MNDTQKTEPLPRACLILPTYNEVGNIEPLIKEIFTVQSNIDTHHLHVIVIDDHSPDGTADIVEQQMKTYSRLHLISGPKTGLGDAYKRGFSFALETFNPDLLLQMDADGQHDPKHIPQFIDLTNKGYDLVIGSRLVMGGGTPHFTIWRRFLSVFGNLLVRFAGGINSVKDCTSGFRCIKADLVTKCNLGVFSTRGYSFQSSLVYELLRNDAKPIEIPIMFDARTKGRSKLSFSDQVEFVFNLTKIAYRNSGEFIKYCFVGILGVMVNIGVYTFLVKYFQVRIEIAPLIAIEISILSNFMLNNYWTFVNRPKKLSFLKKVINFHLAAGFTGLIFYYAMFLFMVKILGFNDILSMIISVVTGTVSNFTINSYWTWSKTN